LAFGTVILAILIAVPLGTLAAWRMGGWLDRLLSGFFSGRVFSACVCHWLFAHLLVCHSFGMAACAGL
jgi:ABC-type dipeptide/oligopeptide/nickel transport system permease component